MNSTLLEELLEERQELMKFRREAHQKIMTLTTRIDALESQKRGEQLLNQLSKRDQELLTQTVRGTGIKSQEVVNGQRTVR